ncbi:MAG: PTS transporter subunit EIIB [Brevinema sp.]
MNQSFFQKIGSFFQNCCKKKSHSYTCTTKTDTVDLLEALGGKENIKHLDACITRLRLELNNPSKICKTELKKHSVAVIEVQNGVQLVLGTKTQLIKEEMEQLLNYRS